MRNYLLKDLGEEDAIGELLAKFENIKKEMSWRLWSKRVSLRTVVETHKARGPIINIHNCIVY